MDQGTTEQDAGVIGHPGTEKLLVRIGTLEQNLREVAQAIARGQANKIYAIKAWRAATGTTLKDAKDYIDKFDDVRESGLQDQLYALERRVTRLENAR